MNDCFSRRKAFAARLPSGARYTSSHSWLIPQPSAGLWRVGLTEFALRMLGELVVVEFEKKPGTEVALGEVVGLIEGFKAVSDLFCAGSGIFIRGNPALQKGLGALESDPYGEGWLYELAGQPDAATLNAEGYQELLGVIVDRHGPAECPDKLT